MAFSKHVERLSSANLQRRLRARLTGGMKDFFKDVKGVEATVGANAFTSPTDKNFHAKRS